MKYILLTFSFSAVGMVMLAVAFFAWTKQLVQNELIVVSPTTDIDSIELERFPVGVNSVNKEINEDPLVDWYMETNLSINVAQTKRFRVIDKVLAQVATWDWYQNLASPVSRILVIYPGERHEEVVNNIGDILKWTTTERDLFYTYIAEAEPYLEEGKFFPGRYVVPSDASPELVADVIYEKFNMEILARYDEEVERFVPIADALAIASLLEREAYDFTDMRYISGIIWNRLFIGMPLQLDATLQYARGSKLSESLWWPKVVPDDKYIESPFNTYQNPGLPPAPIANASTEAVVAALNPKVTDCMFYFHDTRGRFYCTNTYEEHVTKLREIYGQGR